MWHKKLEIPWIRSSWSAAQRSSASPPATHCASVLISRCSVQVQVCSVATNDCLTQGAIYIVYCCRCQVANHCGLLVAACLMSLWLSLKPTTCPDPESTRACFLQLVFQHWSLDFLSLLTNSDFTFKTKIASSENCQTVVFFQRSSDCPFCPALPVRECVCVCVCVHGCMCVCAYKKIKRPSVPLNKFKFSVVYPAMYHSNGSVEGPLLSEDVRWVKDGESVA